MLPFQRRPPNRWRFDTSGEPMLIVPKYDRWLTHYWPMEENGTNVRVDIVGSLDLSPSSSVSRVSGIENYGVPQVSMGAQLTATGAVTPTSILCSVWFYLDWDTVIYGQQGVFSLHPENLLLAVYNKGATYVGRLVSNQLNAITGTTDLPDHAWHHMVGFSKDGRQYLACDGVYQGTQIEGPALTALSVATRADAITPQTFDSNGTLDEVAVWLDADFSDWEDFARFATALYNDGAGIFFDGTDWYEVV